MRETFLNLTGLIMAGGTTARECIGRGAEAVAVTFRAAEASRPFFLEWLREDRAWRRRLRKGYEARIGDCLVRVPAPKKEGDGAELLGALEECHRLLGEYLATQEALSRATAWYEFGGGAP